MTATVIKERHRKPRRDSSPDSFIGRLNLEWDALKRDPEPNSIVARWPTADRALTGLTTLERIEEAVAGRRADERIDAIFYALARRATGTGPEAGLAARILTQLMLPKAILIARTCACELGDKEEQIQLAVCALYEVIRTFPVQRRKHRVPSHIAWDTAHAVRRSVLAQTAELADDGIDGWPTRPSEPNASEQVARLLAWAVAGKVITGLDARLLTARYCAEDRTRPTWRSVGSLSQAAAEAGLSLVAARQRCSRAVRKITAVAGSYPGKPALARQPA